MASQNPQFVNNLSFNGVTICSHRFYSNTQTQFRIEIVLLNGERFYLIQQYRFSNRTGAFKPYFSFWFDSQTWNRFRQLVLQLSAHYERGGRTGMF